MKSWEERILNYEKITGFPKSLFISGEVMLTAFAHYAEAVEGLQTDDVAYKLDAEGREFFETHKPEEPIEEQNLLGRVIE